MRDTTVKSLAEEICISVDRLVLYFYKAGINKTTADPVTQQEKEILLRYLKSDHGNVPKRLILQRKTRSTLCVPSVGGKSKSVKIEIRKKCTYVQHDLKSQDRIEMKQKTQDDACRKNKEPLFFDKVNRIRAYEENDLQIKKNTESEENIGSTKRLSSSQQSNQTMCSSQNKKNVLCEVEASELKRKTEEAIIRKIEEKNRQISEEMRRMAEEHAQDWNNESNWTDEDTNNYHITTSHHAQEAEDESDRKIEMNRRDRSRAGKFSKKKRNSRLFESKTFREMVDSSGRIVKNKLKPNILTHCFNKPAQTMSRNVVIGETITVAELASKMAAKSSEVIKLMMKLGIMATINQVIDQETAQLVVEEMGHKVVLRRENELEESVMLNRNTCDLAISEPRSPIVTFMGHVDHGKTSLLDYIRSSKVAENEIGGITQRIGAYCVTTENGTITFIDTPGHEAFTAMRTRGIQITDIVVLVVAVDDGVKPQTIEAIQQAKSAKVPILVAINKMDKPEANPVKVKNDLIQYGLLPEELGGDSQFVYVSAKSGKGVDKLLDAILLQAEMLELKAVKNSMASGIVIESFLDKSRGPIATIIIREGTLNRGDIVLCGFEHGRIRAIRNDVGLDISSAGPAKPVEILGLSGVPSSGDEVIVVRDERKAREVALYRQGKFKEIKLANQQKSKIEKTFTDITKHECSELNIVLKADVQGSMEAINNSLINLSSDKLKIKVIGSGVGSITETDAALAVASKAILIGFNVHANSSARRIIESENLRFYYYSVIYDLIDKIKEVIDATLTPKYKREVIGLAEVRHVFRAIKLNSVAGCIVKEGIVKRNSRIRVFRNDAVVYEGELESLRRFKEDVNEVHSGMECGVGIKNYNNIRIGDFIEVFKIIENKNIIDQ